MDGPTIIFDKSALQILRVDESCWLDAFFTSNLTPLLYIETLADLEKDVARKHKRRRIPTPQEIVGELALKTPSVNCWPNIHHQVLFAADLLGLPVRMSNRPAIGRGQRMQSAWGRGAHYGESAEAQALGRWRQGDFLAVEREFARQWRHDLSSLSFEKGIALARNAEPERFNSMSDIKEFVDLFVQRTDGEALHLAFELQDVPGDVASEVGRRWLHSNRTPLCQFAPYAAHILKVDLFFFLSLASDLISKDRTSNRADIAYLYYLPFTMVFASDDRLHMKTAPLFMEMNQVFVHGQDLKAALQQLDSYYSGLPDEVKAQGIIKFAPYPPEDCGTLVSELWDGFSPSWRRNVAEAKMQPGPSRPSDVVTVEHLERVVGEAMPIDQPLDKPDYYYFERAIDRTKGKWNILPQDID